MNERQNYLAEGFRNVDRQTDIEKFKTCLTAMESLSSFRTYKEETYQLLKPEDGGVGINIRDARRPKSWAGSLIRDRAIGILDAAGRKSTAFQCAIATRCHRRKIYCILRVVEIVGNRRCT